MLLCDFLDIVFGVAGIAFFFGGFKRLAIGYGISYM